MSIQEKSQQPEAPKPGISSTAKMFLILAGIGGLCLLLYRGIGGYFADSTQTRILQSAPEIGQGEKHPPIVFGPGGSLGGVGFSPTLWWGSWAVTQAGAGGDNEPTLRGLAPVTVKWSVYRKGSSKTEADSMISEYKPMLMLMESDDSTLQGNPEEQRKQMLDSMRQHEMGGGAAAMMQGMAGGISMMPGSTLGQDAMDTDIQVQERQTKDLTVRGQKAEFEFIKGTTGGDGKMVRQVLGSFAFSKGVAMLMLIVPDKGYDEEAVVKMIESIR